jgi:hypothetical protein
MQGSPLTFISDIQISTAIDQLPHDGPMTMMACPMQRSSPMIRSDIEINSAIDQHRYNPLITLCTCIMQDTCI